MDILKKDERMGKRNDYRAYGVSLFVGEPGEA